MAATLLAKTRTEFKRSSITEIKEAGNIPAVVYGKETDNLSIYVSSKELLKLIREIGRNGIISLEIDGETQNVLLHDYQMDSIRNEMIHADFLVIDLTEELTVDVSVFTVGESMGEKDGGILQQTLHEVSVTATPNNIPQSIEVKIDELQIGDTITIGDLKVSENYTIDNEDDEAVVTILPPQEEEEETDLDDAPTEPELIGADDEEDEE